MPPWETSTSPKGFDVSQGKKNKPNQHLPRNPQIKPSVRLPRDCHQTIPTSPKMIDQTIFTSPKLYKPYHLYVSQGENHTISTFPKEQNQTILTSPWVQTIQSLRLPRNKTRPSLHLTSKKTKPSWHLPRKQNHTILTPPKLFKQNNHDISQEKKITPGHYLPFCWQINQKSQGDWPLRLCDLEIFPFFLTHFVSLTIKPK